MYIAHFSFQLSKNMGSATDEITHLHSSDIQASDKIL